MVLQVEAEGIKPPAGSEGGRVRKLSCDVRFGAPLRPLSRMRMEFGTNPMEKFMTHVWSATPEVHGTMQNLLLFEHAPAD